jgi:hypothetical protein
MGQFVAESGESLHWTMDDVERDFELIIGSPRAPPGGKEMGCLLFDADSKLGAPAVERDQLIIGQIAVHAERIST